MHSIRIKITAVTIAAVLTSILAMGGIGILTIGMESDISSAEKMKLISENMQGKLDSYLNSLKQSVDMAIRMANDTLKEVDISLLGGDLDSEDAARLDEALKEHGREIEHALGSIAASNDAVITYYYCMNADLYDPEYGFFWSRLGEDEFTRQPVLDSRDLDINDQNHTTWYYSPLKAGRPVWIGPYKAHFLGELDTVSYVAPVYCHGFLIGVLGMDIPFDTLVDLVSSLRVYDTGFVFLMNKDGDVLYHPDFEMGSNPSSDIPELDGEEIFTHSSSGESMIRYKIQGEERQLAFTSLSNHMKVAVAAPVSEINASRRHMTVVLLLVAVVILAVFTVVTLILMNAVTKPLLKLTAASQRLAAGDYEVELSYDGDDEVGMLTRAFRRMRDHLELYISDLNSRAYTDNMTGMKNKGAFTITLGRLNEEMRKADVDNLPVFAIVVFDCNDLKYVNDHFGHIQGDIYLKTATELICRIFAHSQIFRLGGDEFAAILQGEDYDNREDLLSFFRSEAGRWNESVENPWERINISMGMSDYDSWQDENVEQILQRADAQMYIDKRRQKKKAV